MKTQKFILTTVIFLLVTLCANAYDFTVNGIYYQFISNTGNVEVTNSGEYPNLYKGDIVIPSTVSWEGKNYQVTMIGNDAFYGAAITSCKLPNTVTNIASWAFSFTHLTDITIPVSVTTIEAYAFWGNDKMTVVNVENGNQSFSSSDGILFDKEKTTLILFPAGKTETTFSTPGSVTIIGNCAFGRCLNLTSISIAEGVTTIDNDAFSNCENLSSISLPNSVTSIGNSAFYSCLKLKSVTLPNAIKEINSSTFSSSGLTNITIPGSVTSIGYSAFSSCRSLTSITLPNRLTNIESYAFSECSNLTTIIIPNSVTSIGYYAFMRCSSLTSITLPNKITSINSGICYNCSSLASITLPDGVENIEQYAFYGCKIMSVKIPNSVTFISGSAFINNLFTEVIIDDNNPNYTTEDGILYNKDKTILMIYPSGKPATSFIVPNTVKAIGEYAFEYNTKLTSIVLPEGLETIEWHGFNRCSIESIVLPNTLKEIGWAAFEMTPIKSITIPASVETIRSWAFTKCPYLEYIVFEGPVKTMGADIFRNWGFNSRRVYTLELKCPPFTAPSYFFTDFDLENSTLIVPDGMRDLFLVESGWKDFSTIIESTFKNGIDYITNTSISLYLKDGALTVNSPVAETITIYSVNGMLIYSGNKQGGKTLIPTRAIPNQILIVRGSSGWVKKIMQ